MRPLLIAGVIAMAAGTALVAQAPRSHGRLFPPQDLGLLEAQRKRRGWSGGIVTNANCAATMAAVALAPLHETFGVKQVFITTMQAISGAGYPGVPSLDILGNVIPYIGDEEPKIEREINKMLGRLSHGGIDPAPFVVSAHANRVATENGHLVCLSVACERPVSADDANSERPRFFEQHMNQAAFVLRTCEHTHHRAGPVLLHKHRG